ncbi:hypothetical protein Nepgr_031654 [Nepenthes gracilis]|uniref:Cytochrome P450 n=1 Tax=Nepenthes gracilis TaxID=150966 RepID=A0AAD3TIX4_NEPGR|nr:hypothetical protein Nepgr_031654 [Nepenthes gracilis]
MDMNHFSYVFCLLLLFLSTQYLLFLLKRTRFNQKQLPPGPFPLPVIGNVLNHITNPYRSFAEIAKVYGPVMTVQLVYLTTVVISSATMARQNLFVTGTDITSTTFKWVMTELIGNPEKLEKAQAKLKHVIGNSNLVEEDIAWLPYLQAVVKETLRLHLAMAFLIPRKVAMDVHLFDYTMPKGAQVLVNVWAMGREESMWEAANSFIPKRFMKSNIDVKGGNFELLPFGAGRRICPGMPLANRMVPYMLGSLIHSFNWKLEDGIVRMNMDDKFGFRVIKALPLCAIPFPSC